MKKKYQGLQGKASFRITRGERMILDGVSENLNMSKSEFLRSIFRDYYINNVNYNWSQDRIEIKNKSNQI